MRAGHKKYLADIPHCIGLLGDPVEHSLSPVIHNAAFREQRLPFVYLPLLVHDRDLKRALMAMQLTDIEGCNVTAPHKQTVVPYLDRLDPSAKSAGAVNTIYRRKRKWVGANTDGAGFLAACRSRGISLGGKSVTILGAGGVASAILAVLSSKKVRRVIVMNRTVARAQRLRSRFRKKTKMEIIIASLTPKSCRRHFPETDILIHATSAGHGKSGVPSIPLHLLPPGAAVCDCQYQRKSATRLLRQARKQCRPVIDGLDLLLAQAAASYRLWTGCRAPLPTMRRAVCKFTRLR